ncbi:MAG: hypothetical protein CFE33_13715 [Pseudorhodobacter sp. PARRP1]|nr:MAG: hypothetical protein CFE33_13715 [Pseudorhodobacter sp. PARRP1]
MFTPTISAGFKIINILPDTNTEKLGAAITLQNGNLLLLSESYGSNGEVFMRQFTPDGRSLTLPVQVNTTTFGSQKDVEVTRLANGNFVVGWTDTSATAPDFSGTTVRFQMFDAAGNKVGGETTTPTVTSGDQVLSSVEALDDGRFAVVWTHRSESALRLQIYNADGTPAGVEQTLTEATDVRVMGTITSYGAHGFAHALVTGNFSNTMVSVQRYSDSGNPVGGPIVLATGPGFRGVQIEELSDGRLAVTWTDISETPPYNHGSVVRGQVLNPNGTLSGGVFTVSDDIFSEHRTSKITALSDGRFVVTWNTGPADEVYQHRDVMRIYNANGTPASETITVYDQQQDYSGVRLLSGSITSISELPDGRLVFSYNALTPSGSDFITATRVVDPRSALDVTLGVGHDNFTGTRFADAINGGGGDDSLFGGNGNDRLDGGSGNDSLLGGAGNDSLTGGLGDDRLQNDAGNDTLDGGSGNDTVVFVGTAAATVSLALTTAQATGYGTDTLRNIENVLTGSGNDDISGNGAANRLQSGAGDDTLRGWAGDDQLYAGAGMDRLTGGLGRDLLYGGANDGVMDTFVFTAITDSVKGAARDVIFDFVSGTDKVDLTAIDANTAVAGNQVFGWGGTTATANAVWVSVSGANLLLRGDVTGDGVYDFEIQLAGTTILTASDLLL